MRKVTRLTLVVLAAVLVTAPAFAAETAPRPHPYLFFQKEDIPALQERLKHPKIAALFETVRNTALRPRQEQRQGNNVLCAGVAYCLTGDRAYAEPALRIVAQLVSDGRPWVPTRGSVRYVDLNTAIKTVPLAYAYDMLYDAMTEQEREAIRQALRTKVFPNYLEALAIHDQENRRFTDHQGRAEWWTNCYFNWNPWINGDIGLAALATLADIPESREVLQKARESLKYTHHEFAQGEFEDGGWDEGVMYWSGHMAHSTQFYAALEHVLGTDDGFFDLPGVEKTMQYGIDFVAPDGKWVNFADCPDRLVLDPPGQLYFLAARFNKPQYMRHIDDNAASWHPMPLGVIWRPLLDTPPPDPRPRAHLYRDVNWALLTAGSLYVPFKSGDLGANHGQWEDNNLLLWVNGERMLNDPGYGFRNTMDHNCLLVDGQGQRRGQGSRNFGGHTTSVGTVLACGTVGEDSYLVSEAASCYAGALERCQRHVIVSPRGYVIVLDDAVAAKPAQFTVNWHTLHNLQLAGPDVAVIAGQTERLFIASAADSAIEPWVGRAAFDQKFQVHSPRDTKAWRLVTVLAPGSLPALQAQFTGEGVAVSVNGRLYRFAPQPGGGYRYKPEEQGGPVMLVPPADAH